ncbi:hypothetical protein HDU67_003504 [Dinochytrium kinnereticum]|nr:hypothetical protein HDU67_003504 [Dinochytrium kinnereticum]
MLASISLLALIASTTSLATAAPSLTASTSFTSSAGIAIAISNSIQQSVRQDPSTPLIPTSPRNRSCDAILDKAALAVTTNCKSFQERFRLPLSDSDYRAVVNGLNAAAKSHCEDVKCQQAGMPFAADAAKACPANYIYSLTPGSGVKVDDITGDRTEIYKKSGACTKDANNEYCAGPLMGNLFRSYTSSGDRDSGKYKSAVCSECMRRWVNSGSIPITLDKTTIDAAEVDRVCGVGFLKGEIQPSGSSAAFVGASAANNIRVSAIKLYDIWSLIVNYSFLTKVCEMCDSHLRFHVYQIDEASRIRDQH